MLDNIFAICDKKCVCSDHKFTRAALGMLGTFSMSGSVVGGIGGVGIYGSGGTGRGGGNFGGGRGDGGPQGHPHLSSAAVPGPCIRYLLSLQIQFICTVYTASCRI